MKIPLILISFLMVIISSLTISGYAAVNIPGTSTIVDASIGVNIATDGSITSAKDFGFRILQILKIAVSGIALIYMVLIGAYMVIGADSEEAIKKQRKQITYTIIAFLFLNIPSVIYDIFFLDTPQSIGGSGGSWSMVTGGIFWNSLGFEGIFGNIISFLRVFIFGAAVTMFTWGFFSLIVSGGDDEKKKKAKNRIVYGLIALIFTGFVGVWARLVAVGDFVSYIPAIGNTLFTLAMYFVAPVVIFMLMIGAYYMITSAGDEERAKKGKAIVINTGIAVIILLTALSFMTDLIKFQL